MLGIVAVVDVVEYPCSCHGDVIFFVAVLIPLVLILFVVVVVVVEGDASVAVVAAVVVGASELAGYWGRSSASQRRLVSNIAACGVVHEAEDRFEADWTALWRRRVRNWVRLLSSIDILLPVEAINLGSETATVVSRLVLVCLAVDLFASGAKMYLEQQQELLTSRSASQSGRAIGRPCGRIQQQRTWRDEN